MRHRSASPERLDCRGTTNAAKKGSDQESENERRSGEEGTQKTVNDHVRSQRGGTKAESRDAGESTPVASLHSDAMWQARYSFSS